MAGSCVRATRGIGAATDSVIGTSGDGWFETMEVAVKMTEARTNINTPNILILVKTRDNVSSLRRGWWRWRGRGRELLEVAMGAVMVEPVVHSREGEDERGERSSSCRRLLAQLTGSIVLDSEKHTTNGDS
uniref:Uncharacterized protein n=1 Tax=Oryza brachyantha TaxID=4533 RepID=J3LKG7_ORYBR